MSRGMPREVDCENTCPAEWIYKCIRSIGHAGAHLDWTDRPWTDKDLERLKERAQQRAERERSGK